MAAMNLPARSFAEAVPYLRAPYTPSVIRFRIQTVPENRSAPCVVVLFVTSETVMDRFNIVCGPEWTPPKFKVLVHREISGANGKPSHYVKLRATFLVFGQPFTDTGEASDKGEAQSEFNARAQAFKRAARWAGPGQSLYQPSAIKMFRGPGAEELRFYSDDPKKAHIDERSEAYLLGQYDKVLAEKIIPIYGQPFDHLAAVNGDLANVEGRPRTLVLEDRVAAPVIAADAPRAEAARELTGQPPAAAPAGDASSNRGAAAIRDVARAAGYSDALTEPLMLLVRGDDQGALSNAQGECVQEWITVLSALQIPESTILDSVGFALENCSTCEGARVKFAQWVAAKVSAPPGAERPGTGATAPASNGHAAADTQVPPAVGDAAEPGVEGEVAMRELRSIIERLEYNERSAARIAALAIGADPDGRIEISKIAPATIRCVGELLDAAATLQWSTAKLDEEVSRAHNSTQQGTSASRFGAFAIHLINSAEARVEEDARAAEAAAATV